ncbi:PAS domain protein [Candidatus Gastranaerophilus sp. (ex Termes propinquus)]|nr:PAS domain protein [Candidatus Gastranaerophilus sp. (ex Termes propinquus)]
MGIINDVLDMAKIEEGKLELSPIEYDFKEMVQNVASMIEFRTNEKQQSLTAHIDENIPDSVVGDDKRLAQVITNLLSNAAKFTPANGEIHLEASLAEETDNECELRISVTDTGIGMTKEQKEKIFKPFEQAESDTSRKFGGTGLGLTISKNIVGLMGGDIQIKSEPGKGTEFSFTVKVERGAGLKKVAATGEPMPGEFVGKKVLFAEDTEINREIFGAILESSGLEIDYAENGAEAVEMVKTAPDKYGMVFMDMEMPTMGGLEATRQLRSSGINVPIVAMTANVFMDNINECAEAGMNGHLGKPFDFVLITETLRKYLSE